MPILDLDLSPGTTVTLQNGFTKINELVDSVNTTSGAINNGIVYAANGSAAAPSYTYLSDQDTGFYRIGPNAVGITVGGTKAAHISAVGVNVNTSFTVTGTSFSADGSVGSPSITFTADNNTGFYRIGADSIGFSAGGVKRFEVKTAGVYANVNLVMGGQNPVKAANGTVAAPAYTFNGDEDNGMYRVGTNSVGFVAAGARVVEMKSTSVNVNTTLNMASGKQLQADAGSAATPALIFGTQSTTGFYQVGSAASVGFSVGGTKKVQFSSTEINVNTALTVTGVLSHQDGLVGTPALTFTSDADTGLYRIGPNSIGFAAGGVKKVEINATNMSVNTSINIGGAGVIKLANGSISAPSLSFTGSPNSGLYRLANDILAVSINSAKRLEVKDTLVTVNTALTTTGIWTTSVGGTAAAPSITFIGDLDTGIYRVGPDAIGFTAAGVKRAHLSTSAFSANVRVLSANGSAAAPAHGFTGDDDTGLYRVGADSVGIVVGGARNLQVDFTTGVIVNTALTVTGATLVGDGTAALPGVRFSADTNTGMYRVGADSVGITAGGARRLEVKSAGVYANTALTVTGAVTLSSTLDVTSSITGGSLNTGGTITAGGNIVSSAGAIVAGANYIQAGNGLVYGSYFGPPTASALGIFYSQGNIVYLRPNGYASGTGEAQLSTAGQMWATGGFLSPNWYESTGATVGMGTNGAGTCYMRPNGVGSASGQTTVSSTGNMVVNGTVTATSDASQKTDVETIANALDKLSKLRGVSFTWLPENKNGEKSIGLIAQEVEEVIPEIVHVDDEGLKSVAYGNLAGLFIEAIKELTKKVDAQQAEIEALKAQIKQRD
jgi:hypothetical protein